MRALDICGVVVTEIFAGSEIRVLRESCILMPKNVAAAAVWVVRRVEIRGVVHLRQTRATAVM